MQVALISLADGVAPDEGVHAGLPAAVAADGSLARAYLRIGGLSLAEHQAGWALRAGCRRILLHGSQISGHLLALQQSIEASGAEVRILHHASALAGNLILFIIIVYK